MIVTVDCNPKLIQEYLVEDFVKTRKNRYEDKFTYGGGNGCSCAKLIVKSGDYVTLLTFAGGENGKNLLEELKEFPLDTKVITIKDETQEEILIRDRRKLTFIDSPEPRITREEISQLYLTYQEIVAKSDVILLTANDRESLPEDVYRFFVRHAYQSAIPIIVHPRSDELNSIIEEKPYFLVMQKEQLEEFTKLKINFTHEVQQAANIVLEKGIGNILISGRNQSAIVCTKNKSYRIENISEKDNDKQFDLDYVATGIALGIERNYDIETTLKLGCSLGLQERDYGRAPMDRAEIKSIMTEVEIKEI